LGECDLSVGERLGAMEAELASYFDASLEQEDGTRRTAEEWLYQV
jgi:hypothetical protein